MIICRPNFTFSVLDFKMEEYLALIDNRQLVGIFGKCIDRIFEKLYKRKCKILGSNEVGKRLVNGSYTGILNLLYEKKADLFLKPSIPYLDDEDEKWIKRTLPTHNEKHVIFQVIKSDQNEKILDLLIDLNFELNLFLMTIVIWSLSILLMLFLVKIDSFRRQKQSKFDLDIGLLRMIWIKFEVKQSLSATGFYVIVLSLHFFLCQQIIQNFIKVNKVVISTSGILTNEQDIFGKTKKVPFYIEDETDRLSYSSPNGSFLQRVYALSDKTKLRSTKVLNEKSTKVIFSRDQLSSDEINYYEIFSIISELAAYSLISVLNGDYFNSIVFISNEPVFEFYNIHYHSCNTNFLSFIGKFSYFYLENGIFQNSYDCTMMSSFQLFQKKVNILTKITDYIEMKTTFDSLKLINFYYTIELFFAINLTILLIFSIVNKCSNLSKR